MRLNISFVFYLCVVAVVGGVAAAPAVAQSTVQLSGIVQDSSGASIPGATVVIEGPASSFSRIVESGRDGAFVVPSLTAGRYQLTVVATGFDAVTTTVEVYRESASDDCPAAGAGPRAGTRGIGGPSGRITPGSQRERRRHLSRAHRSDRRRNRRRSPSRFAGGADASRLRNRRPGRAADSGHRLAAGGGADRRPTNSVGARGIKRGIVNLDRQSTARLDRVEVVKGASSALYGSDAIGGVINLITKERALGRSRRRPVRRQLR